MCDAGCPDHLSPLVANWRKRNVHRDSCAVFANALGSVVLDRLTLHQLSCDSRDLVRPLRRAEDSDRHTDRFGGAVSVEPFSALIPTGDDSVYVSRDDGIVGGLDHVGHPSLDLLCARLRLGALAGKTGGKYRDGNKHQHPPVVIGGQGKTEAWLKDEIVYREAGCGGAKQSWSETQK